MTAALRHLACPFCPHTTAFTDPDVDEDSDPDAAFGDLLSHIRWEHGDQDQTPAVLWPKIKEKR
ncbi:hypothetical protein [Dactylosporangium sp. CA-139066]|uniref:hypothetical protein n=1 Tax=Dactylosporangium sp. CA-139066 TaxID=3239930 RepID=UPI003D8DEE8B